MNGIFEKRKLVKLNQVQYIAVGFFFIILIGAGLLTLPIAS